MNWTAFAAKHFVILGHKHSLNWLLKLIKTRHQLFRVLFLFKTKCQRSVETILFFQAVEQQVVFVSLSSGPQELMVLCSHSPPCVCKDVFMNVFILHALWATVSAHWLPQTALYSSPASGCWNRDSWAAFWVPLLKQKHWVQTHPPPCWVHSVCTDHSGFLKTWAWAPQTDTDFVFVFNNYFWFLFSWP